MEEFFANLKQQAKENPLVTVIAVGAVLTTSAVIIEVVFYVNGSRAYVKAINAVANAK